MRGVVVTNRGAGRWPEDIMVTAKGSVSKTAASLTVKVKMEQERVTKKRGGTASKGGRTRM